MALTSRLTVRAETTYTDTLDLATPSTVMDYLQRFTWASGTGADQSNLMWSDQRTLSASATENLDLAGSLVDEFGNTLTFARIKAIIVTAAAANTNNVNVIREGTNGVPLFLALADGIPVRPGGAFAWVAPDATAVAVTPSTGDLLTFTNSGAGTSVTYDVIIIGASA